MQTIHFKNENRGQGMSRALDELWDSWQLLKDGFFSETEEAFTLESTDGSTFKAAKTGEPFAAKMYNRHFETDKQFFEVYEGQNPTGGYFILYRFSAPNKRNEFVISTIGGVAEGSSIHFEVKGEAGAITNSTSYVWKMQKFNSQELGLISMSYMKGLFPKAKIGELLNDKGDGNGGFTFYYDSNYYDRYSKAFKEAYNSGTFANSNAESDWNNLMTKVISAQLASVDDKASLEEYWLNE
ncbi:MAG: hypothetical protein EOO10_17790, partial [Chitinophagaceae bacterium]